MRSRWHIFLTLLLLLLIAGKAFSAVDLPGTVTAPMRQEDPRLEKHVTVRSPHMYVGELLETLSEQTGVEVFASDRDGAAGEKVAVFVKDAPLGDVMNALWSLLSYKGATRRWLRTQTKPVGDAATKGEMKYQFLRPPLADQLAAKLKDEIQQDMESETATFLDALKLSPEELQKAADNDPRLNYLVQYPRGRAGLQFFADAFTAEQRQQILRGDKVVQMDASQLSESGRAFLAKVRGDEQKWNPGMALPDTGRVTFKAMTPCDSLTPSLFIVVAPFGGFAYTGGNPMENRWRGNVDDLWTLPGDSRSNAEAEAKTAHEPKSAYSYNKEDDVYRLGRRLTQLSETDAAPSVIMARLPMRPIHTGEFDPGNPYSHTLADYLTGMQKAGFPHKWREGALLIAPYNWLSAGVGPDAESINVRLSWSRVKRLRAELANNDGFLTLASLCELEYDLTPVERERLSFEDVPVVGELDRRTAGFAEILAFLGNHAAEFHDRILSKEGLPLSQLPSAFVDRMSSLVTSNAAPLSNSEREERITRVRVVETRMRRQETSWQMFTFEGLSASGRVLCRSSFSMPGERMPDAVKAGT